MKKLFIFISLSFLLTACYTTKNLPDEEILYRGIKKLDYDAQLKRKPAQEQGVITAIADAYTTVEGLLSGDANVLNTEEENTEAPESHPVPRMRRHGAHRRRPAGCLPTVCGQWARNGERYDGT